MFMCITTQLNITDEMKYKKGQIQTIVKGPQ